MDSIAQGQLMQVLRTFLRPTKQENVEVQCGESRSFSIKELGSEPSEGENQITLLDQLGQAHHFEVDSHDPLLRRIRGVADGRQANCVVTRSENKILLVVTKDIHKDEELLAAFLTQHLPATVNEDTERKYPCPLCKVKFSSRQRLLAHQTIYCSAKNGPPVSLPQPVALPPSLLPTSPQSTALPNVILLPLAFHDQPQTDLVQLLGPPQTIVPVAVGRSSIPPMNPLLVQSRLCAAVTIPPALVFTTGGTPLSIPIMSIDTPSTSLLGKRTATGSSPPLDLSKRPAFGPSPPVTHCKAGSSSEVEKPFVCTCGVAFSAETTLKAHQQYYCKDVERNEEPREPQRKVPSRCSQCDFEPHSQSQLSVHVRSAHSEVQAYVCKVCGYRGFSIRGIRSHMRSHPTLQNQLFESLKNTYITVIKAEEPDEEKPNV